MAVSRVTHVDERFRTTIAALGDRFQRVSRKPTDTVFANNPMTVAEAVSLFQCQLQSRWIDYVARELKNEGHGFYTIGSAGHEGNAMVGQLTRHTDPAFLHYRSGGFFFARAAQVPGQTPLFDTCLSLTASVEDPISGGRHKVWGSTALNIPPQTSTIASHLPKAMGMAFFLERRDLLAGNKAALQGSRDIPEDSIVVCSFGDASVNHSTAVGAINAAAWASFQHLPVPLLMVCEDNGIGISVRTPENWVESNYRNRAGITYFQADGLDMRRGYPVVRQAIEECRRRRRPVFLHLKTVRLLGHAGSDVETNYRTREQIEALEALDPVLSTAVALVEAGVLSPDEVLAMYEDTAACTRAAGAEAAKRPRHTAAASVMTPLVRDFDHREFALTPIDGEVRQQYWDGRPPETQRPRHMAQLINWGLHDLCLRERDVLVFGEDVAKKGGVYTVTKGLYEKFGVGRVFNTLLDEQTILGLAIGGAHTGLLPIPEIQYLAYLHNAIDQIRGEASSLKFFSDGQYLNPMVVRIAGFAYQRGFGGHFHNDNAFAALREIPGIIMVTASNGPDAVRLMRTSVQLAKQQGAVVVFIEPIALYMTKDLVEKGDWSFPYPDPDAAMPFGEVGFHGDPDSDILVISYANGYYLSRQAAWDLEQEGESVRVMDLRFLLPLNREAIIDAARGKRSVVIVDECRQTGSISEEVTTVLAEAYGGNMPHITRVCGEDTFIPLGTAWEYCLPSRESVREAIRQRIGK
ncbi:Transket-pyr domain-containing protein [Sulfidibacter corallicola]|uniref:3-methyl-2-oxobutanoate dehydrogenase (2-methylpropanoyl-transferring) n=1 Tax=Sulfidibacter corallicola TaxID=2818388 RepID=A0A8A4TXA9_SULCO|nr:thiamine pyrophosphate-dependent enzyme [Sulfidibacter corallicola]QTD53838.1 hypothetical protein J3U87_15420 [Sulfidibacter corallicola]